MKKKSLSILSLALAAAFALPSIASASELSYTHVELGYQHVDTDLNVDADGAYIRGSYEIQDSGMYVLGSYAHLSNDVVDIKPRQSSLGLGYHHSFTNRLDGLAEASYQHTDTRIGNVNGWRFSAGVRGLVTDQWEALAKVNYYDGVDYAGDTTGTVGIQYRITPRWGVATEIEFDGDHEIYQVGLRATF